MNPSSKKKTSKKKQIKLPDLKARKDPKAGGRGAVAPHGPARGGAVLWGKTSVSGLFSSSVGFVS